MDLSEIPQLHQNNYCRLMESSNNELVPVRGEAVYEQFKTHSIIRPHQITATKIGTFSVVPRKYTNLEGFLNFKVIGANLKETGVEVEVLLVIEIEDSNPIKVLKTMKLSPLCPTDTIFTNISMENLGNILTRKGQLRFSYVFKFINKDLTESHVPFSLNPVDSEALFAGIFRGPVESPIKRDKAIPPTSPRKKLLEMSDPSKLATGFTGLNSSYDPLFVPAILQSIYNLPILRKLLFQLEIPQSAGFLSSIQRTYVMMQITERLVYIDDVIRNFPGDVSLSTAYDFYSEVYQSIKSLYGDKLAKIISHSIPLDNKESTSIEEALQKSQLPERLPMIIPFFTVEPHSEREFIFSDNITIKNQIYKLYSVIVCTESGYISYIEPAEASSWYKFNDPEISLVADDETIEKNLCVLMYLKLSEMNNIFVDVNENSVPKQLADETILEWDEHAYKVIIDLERRRTTEVEVYTDDSLRYNTSLMKPEIVGKDTVRICKLDASASPAQAYYDISEMLGVSIRKIRIWNILNNGSVVLLRMTEHGDINALVNYPFYVQKKKEEENTNVPDDHRLLFIKYFDPTTKFPLIYIGSIIASERTQINVISVNLALSLCIPLSTKFECYHEMSDFIKQLGVSGTVGQLGLQNGASLIFQPDIRENPPRIDDNLIESFTCKFVSADFAYAHSKIHFADKILGQKHENVSLLDYIKRKSEDVDISLSNYSDHNAPPVILRIPKLIPFKSLETILNTIFPNIDHHPECDMFLFFSMDRHTKLPSDKPLNEGGGFSAKMLPEDCKPTLFYLHIKDASPYRNYPCESTINLEISEDAVHITDRYSFLLPPDTTLDYVMSLLEQQGALDPSDGAYRCFVNTGGTLVKSLSDENEVIKLPPHSTLRIDSIPADQNGKQLVQVNHAKIDRFSVSRTFGTPFFINVKKSDTVADMKKRISRKLNYTANYLKKINLVIGKPTMKITPEMFLHEKNKIMNILTTLKSKPEDIVILVIHVDS